MSTPRRLVLIGLGVLSLMIRLPGIAREDLWYDEQVTLIDSQGIAPPTATELKASFTTSMLRVRQGLVAVAKHSATHDQPVYVSFIYLWTRIAAPSEVSLRLPSALAGAATVPCVAAIGWRLLGFWPGLLAGGLLAASPLHVHYSQEARTYALSTLAVVLAVLAALALDKAPSRIAYVRFGLAAALVPALHLLAAPTLVPIGCWALSRREHWRRLPLAAFTGAVVWLALVPLGLAQSMGTAHRQSGLEFQTLHPDLHHWPPPASISAVVHGLGATVTRLLGIEYFPLGIQGRDVAPLSGALVLLALIGGLSVSRGASRILIVGGAVVPLAAAAALSVGYGHVAPLQDRYAVWSIPFLALLLAQGACRKRRSVAVVLAGFLLLLLSVFLATQQLAPAGRQCLRGAEARLLAECSLDDAALLVQDPMQVAVLAAWERRPLRVSMGQPPQGLSTFSGYRVDRGSICVVGAPPGCSGLWKPCHVFPLGTQ